VFDLIQCAVCVILSKRGNQWLHWEGDHRGRREGGQGG